MIVVTLTKEQVLDLLKGNKSLMVEADGHDDDYGQVGICCDQTFEEFFSEALASRLDDSDQSVSE